MVDAQVVLEAGLADATYNPDLADFAALITAVAQASADGPHHYHAQIWRQLAAPFVW